MKGCGLGEECIHGLEAGLCDACYPKARPEVPVTATATKTRVTRPRSVSLTAPRKVVPASQKQSTEDVSQHRIFHVTHINNLAAIVEAGALLADATPTVDISSPESRESRRTIVVSDEGDTVASYVPFFLSPESSLWESIRTRAADPRLALDSHSVATDFVVLVTSFSAVGELPTVVADGDAAHALTRYATTTDAEERMLRRLRAENESARLLAAELLVKDSVPLEVVSLITVANDRTRDAVKAILKSSPHSPRVAIHPPWFQGAVE